MNDLHHSCACPRCDVGLVERQLGSQRQLACDRCGGVWLDVVACRQIVERAPDTASLLCLADRSAEAAVVRPDEGAAACPMCRAPMQRTPVPAVEATIDTCVHGTWFDARELRMVAEALKPIVRPPAPAPLPAVPNTPPRSYGDQFDADHAEIVRGPGRALPAVPWIAVRRRGPAMNPRP